MRRIVTVTIPALAMSLHVGASSAQTLCPIENGASQSCGGGGGDPRECTVALPVPADAFDCQCKTTGRDPAQRCSGALPQDICFGMIDSAFAIGLLTSDAVTWLRNNGFCPVHFDAGEGDLIYDFCPMGCFAADTRILTGIPGDGKASYTSAARITPQGTLVAMSDEASLRDVALTSLPIDRVVYGPEEPQLFVFELASGATLRVTQHHPMVLDNGKIVEAAEVDLGMSFVGIDGKPVAITSITREKAIDNVFNFQTAGDTQLGHVIVAEGVLVGDLKLQNELAAEQGSIALRR